MEAFIGFKQTLPHPFTLSETRKKTSVVTVTNISPKRGKYMLQRCIKQELHKRKLEMPWTVQIYLLYQMLVQFESNLWYKSCWD